MKSIACFMLPLLSLALPQAMAAQSRGIADKYSILIDRSIFSRTPVKHSTGSAPTTRPALRPGQILVLSGVFRVNDDDGFAAMIENTDLGTTLRVRPGDGLGQGRVTQISLDSIEYMANGKSLRIKVGQNLEGAEADVTSVAATGSSSYPKAGGTSAAATTQPSADNGGGSGDILERMRQRRMQEMKH